MGNAAEPYILQCISPKHIKAVCKGMFFLYWGKVRSFSWSVLKGAFELKLLFLSLENADNNHWIQTGLVAFCFSWRLVCYWFLCPPCESFSGTCSLTQLNLWLQTVSLAVKMSEKPKSSAVIWWWKLVWPDKMYQKCLFSAAYQTGD